MSALKCGKASGPDGIPPEMWKHGGDILLPYLCVLFNGIFTSGEFPLAWSRSVIFPLHKKGNKNDANNYRGISLMDIIGKLFTFILNCRLKKFVDLYDKIPECQAGFRSGYCTADNVFTLQALIQKYLSKSKGRFYCLFVDFHKAFDSINRDLLWYVLAKHSINGKMLTIMRDM